MKLSAKGTAMGAALEDPPKQTEPDDILGIGGQHNEPTPVFEETGQVLEGAEEISVPLAPELEATITILVGEDDQESGKERWKSASRGKLAFVEGLDWDEKVLSSDLGFPSALDAINAELDNLACWFRDPKTFSPAVVKWSSHIAATLKKYREEGIPVKNTATLVTEGPADAAAVAVAENQDGPGQDPATRDWEERRHDVEGRLCSLAIELEVAKNNLKKLKKAHQAVVEELQDLMDDGPEELPLIDAAEKRAAAEAKEAENPKPVEVVPEDESWRATPIESLSWVEEGKKKKLPAGLCEKLREADLATVGDIADRTKDKGEFWYKELTGVGKVAVDKINAGMDAFWAERAKKGGVA